MAKENNAKRSVPAEIITPEIRSHIESVAADMIEHLLCDKMTLTISARRCV